MADSFESLLVSLDAPAVSALEVTPSDTTDLTQKTRAVYVGIAGSLVVDMNGVTVTFNGAIAGTTIPIRADRIRATGTTAAGIIALW